MSERANPVVERYLKRFENHLRHVGESERLEMRRELESHVAEAIHAGSPLDEVLTALGPADRLAAAYRAELAVQSAGAGSVSLARRLSVFGIIAGTSLPNFVIVAVLGILGLGMTVSGLVAMVAGPLGLVWPDSFEVSAPWPSPLAELSAMALGFLLLVLGLVCLAALFVYARFVYAALRRLVGGVRNAA